MFAHFSGPHPQRPHGPFGPKPFPPVVERMSASQLEAMAALQERAAVASTAATPELLSLLDSAELRNRLQQCCPHLANWSAVELLHEARSHRVIEPRLAGTLTIHRCGVAAVLHGSSTPTWRPPSSCTPSTARASTPPPRSR